MDTLARPANDHAGNYSTIRRFVPVLPRTIRFEDDEVVSADGLRFVMLMLMLNAGRIRKYFHVERGVTNDNLSSYQFSGLLGIVIPGTLHDVAYVLDGLLQNQTPFERKKLMTDTAGYSDRVFGFFWLLGFQFSPRLADIGKSRFWPVDGIADYAPLDGLAHHCVNLRLIGQNWMIC